ncbi:MAG TPA: ABC-F family ATP-binding cassette domain-containing protein [Nitrospiria bacterium]|nr:ABC-F family ATP-binding cassette domain-containing protein [Nitrospiria bacterium]
MNLLDVQNLDKKYAIKQVLHLATFTVGEQEKVGFIGKNGSGKSTLFRILAGLETKDEGIISVRRGATIGYLPQEPDFNPDHTIEEEITSALSEIQSAIKRYDEVNHALSSETESKKHDKLLEEQENLSHWITQHGGWDTTHRLDEILHILDIPDRSLKVRDLSGGLKKRVAIAKLVLESPTLLLLDEPTNHLDARTIQWLEDFLAGYPGAVMLITHDRYFLDRAVTRIIELEDGELTAYPGSYSKYLELKADRLNHEGQAQGRLITLLRNETAWIMRGARARATKSKGRIERYQILKSEIKGPARDSLKLEFKSDARLGDIILEFQYLTKAYGDKILFQDLLLSMKKEDRIGVIGANGCGKSTLLKLILKEELPTRGSVVLGKNTRISYFDQHRSSLDPDQRVEEALGEGAWIKWGSQTMTRADYLESFLFSRHDQRKLIRTLSGGERARLILARIMLEGGNFLLLDEPTNDLDIPTLQLLDEALSTFQGCVFMVTHDRFFLDRVATGILSFEPEGDLVYLEGNYETYLQWKKKKDEETRQNRTKEKEIEKSLPSRKKEKKGLSFKEQSELERLEKEIESAEARKRELLEALSNPSGQGREALEKLGLELKELETRLEAKIVRWELLEEKRADP